MKTMNKAQTADFMNDCRHAATTLTGLGRKEGATGQTRKERKAQQVYEKVKSPLFTILLEAIPEREINCSESAFECKGGLRPALVNAESGQAYEKLIALPIIKTTTTKAKEGLKSEFNQEASREPCGGGKQVLKKLEEMICACVGAELRSKMPLPKLPWADQVFVPEILLSSESYSQAMWTPFGLMQANLLISGDAAFAGIRTEQIPGNTYAEKRAAVLRMPVEQVQEACSAGGFYVRFEKSLSSKGHCLVLIPTGFIVLVACRNAHILRWSLVADTADRNRVKTCLGGCLASFSELREAGAAHCQFAEHLGIPV